MATSEEVEVIESPKGTSRKLMQAPDLEEWTPGHVSKRRMTLQTDTPTFKRHTTPRRVLLDKASLLTFINKQ